MPTLQLRQSEEYQEAHRDDNLTHNIGGFCIVLIIIATACMVLRVLSRSITKLDLARDDWTYLGGSSIAVGSFIVSVIYSFDAGLGEHWITLTPGQKILFPKLNYAFNILNLACYPIIKLSILLFYLRIFITPQFRRLCWAGVVFVSCMCVANTLVAIFACRPVRGFYDASVPAACINYVQFYWATAILNMVTDVYILVLPIPLVWRLQTTLRRKMAILMIFMLGGLTFVVSIIRIVYYLDYSEQDPSWSFWKTAYATPAEVCLAVVVASAPTWRPVWTYMKHIVYALFTGRSRRGAKLSLSAAHTQARSIAMTDNTETMEEKSLIESLEMSRKSSATLVEERGKVQAKKGRVSTETESQSASQNDLGRPITVEQTV